MRTHASQSAGEHRVAERLRSVGVRALADDQERGVLLDRPGGCRSTTTHGSRNGARCAGVEVAAPLDDRAEVLGRGAAAAADDAHAEVGDEPLEMVGELAGREVVVRAPVDDARAGRRWGAPRSAGRQCCERWRRCSVISRGPVAQLRPNTSGFIARSETSAAPISVPTSIRPVVSIVTCTWMRDAPALGRHRPTSADHRRLGLQEVVARLDEEEVDATLEEAAGLHLVGVAKRRGTRCGRARAAWCRGRSSPRPSAAVRRPGSRSARRPRCVPPRG